MKKLSAKLSLVTLFLTLVYAASAVEINAAPPTKIDIYPTDYRGNPIAGKVFTISPVLPNGSSTVVSGSNYARIYVSSNCSTSPSSAPCMNKNVYYTISGGSCFNRLRIRFGSSYSWNTEPNIIFSERYDGSEGFQISGGSYYFSYLLPRTSQYPCG